jgi:Protein of unknown function (DUF805)
VVFFLAWIAASPSNWAIPAALILIANIPAVIAGIAVGIKRLHDRDKSGWWLLLFYLVPGLLEGIGRSIAGPARILGVALGVASAAITIWRRARRRFGLSGNVLLDPTFPVLAQSRRATMSALALLTEQQRTFRRVCSRAWIVDPRPS